VANVKFALQRKAFYNDDYTRRLLRAIWLFKRRRLFKLPAVTEIIQASRNEALPYSSPSSLALHMINSNNKALLYEKLFVSLNMH